MCGQHRPEQIGAGLSDLIGQELGGVDKVGIGGRVIILQVDLRGLLKNHAVDRARLGYDTPADPKALWSYTTPQDSTVASDRSDRPGMSAASCPLDHLADQWSLRVVSSGVGVLVATRCCRE